LSGRDTAARLRRALVERRITIASAALACLAILGLAQLGRLDLGRVLAASAVGALLTLVVSRFEPALKRLPPLVIGGVALAGALLFLVGIPTYERWRRTAEAAVVLDGLTPGFNVVYHFDADGQRIDGTAQLDVSDIGDTKVCYDPGAPSNFEVEPASYRCGDPDILGSRWAASPSP
jgi:hypothetical protein